MQSPGSSSGRKVVASIDKVLGGAGEIEEVLFERGVPGQYLGRDEAFALWTREKVPEIDLVSRHLGFKEVAMGYTEEQAVREAKRCLQCGLRFLLGSNPFPPERMLAFNEENINAVSVEERVFQLYDEEKNTIAIKGSAALRRARIEALEDYENAVWFDFEEDKMYSLREGEMIQTYLQAYGKIPGGEEDDDLF